MSAAAAAVRRLTQGQGRVRPRYGAILVAAAAPRIRRLIRGRQREAVGRKYVGGWPSSNGLLVKVLEANRCQKRSCIEGGCA